MFTAGVGESKKLYEYSSFEEVIVRVIGELIYAIKDFVPISSMSQSPP